MDCGPTCLRMVSKYYGKHYSLQSLREKAQIGKEGVNMLGISEAAEAIGFNTIGVKIGYDELMKNVPLPCVLHWNKNHFIVLPKQKNGWFSSKKTITVADPGLNGLVEIDVASFKKCWLCLCKKLE